MTHLAITVYGQPTPQGSKTRTRYGMRDDNADTLKPWREAVKHAALDALTASATASPYPLAGPVRVQIMFTLRKPSSAPKTRRTWPIKARSGDLDKLQRSCFDALTDAGVWLDDAQVVRVWADKVFVGDPDALHVPGAVIRIWSIEGAA